MPFVLGVLGLPKVEVDLLRIIIRLSSDLMSSWAIRESQPCDVLLVDSESPIGSLHAPSAPFVVVPVMARPDVERGEHSMRWTLARPIFAEEVVDLLNEIAPMVSQSQAASLIERSARSRRASLIRWPTQATLQRNPAYTSLAVALSKSAQSADSLSVLSSLHVAECLEFLGLLEKERILVWLSSASQESTGPTAGHAPQLKTGLLWFIRRRLGLV